MMMMLINAEILPNESYEIKLKLFFGSFHLTRVKDRKWNEEKELNK